MIIEQAFFSLPEMLLGNQYAVHEFEAGIVGLFTMAILQELNGRNVVHPIRHIQAERRYQQGQSRRADLYVNIRKLMVANQRLACYGWRHHNWIEAKFYRNKPSGRKHATRKPAYLGQLIADLVRLTCLVPLSLDSHDSNGRYFLHVYDDQPKNYLPSQKHDWVISLHEPGLQRFVVSRLDRQSKTAKLQFGDALQDLTIQPTVTNFVNFPITTADSERFYWCILTRIDSFSVTLDGRSFSMQTNRLTKEMKPGDYSFIASEVSAKLGSAKESERA